MASRRRRKLDIPKSPSLQRSPPFCGGGGERGDRGRSREGAPLAVSSRRARPRVPGPRLLADSGLDSPAGLQRRVALGQDLEAALEKPYVPVPQEIQALSLPTRRQQLVLHGRHTAAEVTSGATRKQLASGMPEPRRRPGGAKEATEGSTGDPRPVPFLSYFSLRTARSSRAYSKAPTIRKHSAGFETQLINDSFGTFVFAGYWGRNSSTGAIIPF